MLKEILQQSNLNEAQAAVLEYLLQAGETKAIDITKATTLPRGVVYKALNELIDLGLIETFLSISNISIFRAQHPSKIEALFESKARALEQQKKNFQAVLPEILSDYNLALHKPGVRYYEGDEGIVKVLYDSLKSQTEIYTFTDGEQVRKYIPKINEEYSKKRKALKIIKKIIVPDTLANREIYKNSDNELTRIKFLTPDEFPYKIGMQIYDNKISYQAFSSKSKIGVLIEDKEIFRLHKSLFEFIWKRL